MQGALMPAARSPTSLPPQFDARADYAIVRGVSWLLLFVTRLFAVAAAAAAPGGRARISPRPLCLPPMPPP